MIPSWLLHGVLADRKWCVAGGYAACPALAVDIDLWIYDIKDEDLAGRQSAIAAALEDSVGMWNRGRPHWPEKRFRFERENEAMVLPIYDQIENRIEKVGVLTLPSCRKVKPIHVLVTTAPDPGSLISGFDVTTHAVAIDCEGRVWEGHYFTGPHIKPAVTRATPKTQARLDRICKRFGHESYVVNPNGLLSKDKVPS